MSVGLVTIYLHHSLDLSDQCIGIKGTTDVGDTVQAAIASTPANRIDLQPPQEGVNSRLCNELERNEKPPSRLSTIIKELICFQAFLRPK